jgi:phosphoribosyl 1,2-cyclic phosphodiesterase
MKAGVDCYLSQGTADALHLSGHRLHIIKAGCQISIGEWRIMPFAVAHDAAEPLGFLLAKGDDKLLFVTDSNYVPHRVNGLSHIMIGVDYNQDILEEHVRSGRIDIALANRILKNHMSIQTAAEFFRANDMSKVEAIYLLHLSSMNSDPDQFRTEIERITGRPVITSMG